MPSKRLDNTPVQIQRYDVVGEDSNSRQCFVSHVGLAFEAILLAGGGQSCNVVHMKPPLELQGQMQPHVYGTADLSSDEMNQIKLFHDEFRDEYESSRKRRVKIQYFIHPPFLRDLSSDGTIIYYRFSCAGFVLKSYSEAGIDLVDDSDLPVIELSRLISSYPVQLSSRLQNRHTREHLGLEGDGPWPVLLCGYLFHALDRQIDDIRTIPYKPRSGDEFFPRLS